MKNIIFLLLMAFTFSCVEDQNKKITISMSVDENELLPSEYEQDFKIRYLLSNSDTIEIFSTDGFLALPSYDSSMVYLEIVYKEHKVKLTNDFLENVLLDLRNEQVTNWKVEIDTPPFVHDYGEKSDSLKSTIMIKHELGDYFWLCFDE
ncbi:hypothetical protein R9C00_26255 [Flammeovirgaceae bacterium SG7u.111]|nr:hypothetical protein [Flammeovirgaceae bacterium SG7u.132]WPO35202.1 hypothetical protein R9C00_26255 [Flammeovirgaceae bacterium SG7u.111]